MRSRRPRSTRTDTLFPYRTLFRSPRWARCQSVALPFSALYSHIGETTMRLGKVRPRSEIGEKSWLVMTARRLWMDRGTSPSYGGKGRVGNPRLGEALGAEETEIGRAHV